MSSVVDKLSAKDKLQLVALYESQGYSSLKKLIDQTRINIAKNCLATSTCHEDTKFMQGQAFALKSLHSELKELFKLSQKK